MKSGADREGIRRNGSPAGTQNHSDPDRNRQLLAAAEQNLRRHLRAPTASIPFKWNASVLTDREIIDINAVYPLIQAWSRIDVATAQSLVRGVFFLQAGDGSLAARYLPDGTPLTKAAPWPLLIQSAKTVWEASDGDFPGSLLPALFEYADWICYHFDPRESGMPRWRSNEEALVPENFNPHRATPDLAILLLGELEALQKLENAWPDILDEGIDLQPYLARFRKNLQDFFWNRDSEELNIVDTECGASVETPLFYTSLVPMSDSASLEIRSQAKPVLVKALNNFTLPALWPGGETFHVNSVYAFLTIAAAQGARVHAEEEKFCEYLWDIFSNHYCHTGSLPNHLSTALHSRESFNSSGNSGGPLIMSALIAYIGHRLIEKRSQHSRGLALMRRLNRHPALAVGVPAALAAAVVAAVALWCVFQPDPTASRLETGMGLAQHYYQTGRYDEALRICNQYAKRTENLAPTQIMKANILYQLGEYDKAQKLYSSLLKNDRSHPIVYLNMALAFYRKEEYERAVEMYRHFIKNYSRDFPRESQQASRAIRLIRDHSAQDTGEVGNQETQEAL